MKTEYKTRSVRFLKLVEYKGWTIKVHGVRFGGERPDESIVQEVLKKLPAKLPQPAVTDARYGAAILIIHQGMDANWLLLGHWRDGEILEQHLYRSSLENPGEIEDVSDWNLVGCTWEMAVQAFERDAWVEKVLKAGVEPDLTPYFEQHMNAEV